MRQGAVWLNNKPLEQPKQEGQHSHTVDGLQTEFPAQDFHCGNQKDGIDEQVGDLHLYARGIKHDGCDTSHSACSDLIRQDKAGVCHCIDSKTHRYQQNVTDQQTDIII